MYIANKLTANQFLKNFGKVSLTNAEEKGDMLHVLNLKDALANNSKKMDVYFYPNERTKVKNFRSCYVDLDAGRDDKGNYLPMGAVLIKKDAMWTAIQNSPLKPNLIVDTRNGYHLYWLLKENCKPVDWKRAQTRICNHFLNVGADPLAIKATQLLRVPGTTWYKVYEKQNPYNVTWMKFNNKKTSIQEIEKTFNAPSYPTWVFVNTKLQCSGKNKKQEYSIIRNTLISKVIKILDKVLDLKIPVNEDVSKLIQTLSGKIDVKSKQKK